MDGQRFDDLTRNLGRGATRRGLLRGLGGSALAAAAAALGGRDALANHGGSHGGGGGQGSGGGKSSAVCCPSGYTAVCPTADGGHACIDTTSDPNNCGACGTACPSGVCSNGVCVVEAGCLSGTTDCNGVCVDLSTDVNNCGACGAACEVANGTARCINGTCGVASCHPGFVDCDDDPTNGCETDTTSDSNNCGACGVVCQSGICSNGVCETSSYCATVTCDDGNECTTDACDEATQSCVHTPLAAGIACSTGVCNGAGTCVPI